MNSPEFFPDSPKLTPEEQVRENERLSDIDKAQHTKAKHVLAEYWEGTDEGKAEKARYIFHIISLAQDAAEKMNQEFDSDYQHAQNITVSEIDTRPSRLSFLKRQAAVYHKREIAVWPIPRSLEDISEVYLGHDGELYGTHPDDRYTVKQPVDLYALYMEDLTILKEGLDALVEVYEKLKNEA